MSREDSEKIASLSSQVIDLKETILNKDATIKDLNKQISDSTKENDRKIALMKEDHDREMDFLKKEHDFAQKHFKDDETLKLREKIIALTMDNKVKDEQIASLQKLVDIDADVIDIKQLVSDLLAKIPTMDLKNLSIHTTSDK